MSQTVVDVVAPVGVAQPGLAPARGGRAVQDHLPWAVLCAIFCFTPTGVVAVLHAARVKPLLAAGQVAAARRSSTLAARFCWVSVAVTAAFLLAIYFGADAYDATH